MSLVEMHLVDYLPSDEWRRQFDPSTNRVLPPTCLLLSPAMIQRLHVAMNHSHNHSQAGLEEVRPLPLWLAAPTALVLAAIVSATVVGNLLVVLAIATQKPLKQVQNYFLVSLAVADLWMGVGVMSLAVVYEVGQYWPFSSATCRLWITTDVLCSTSSILNLCAIAVDRYLAISRPFWYAARRTRRSVLTAIGLVWLLSAAISVPPVLFGWSSQFSSKRVVGVLGEGYQTCDYASQKEYVVYSALGSFFIPFLIMTVVYLQIYRVAQFRLRRRRKSELVQRMHAGIRLAQPPANSPSPPADTHKNTPAGGEKEAMVKKKVSTSNPPSSGSGGAAGLAAKISIPKEKKAAVVLGVIMGLFVLCWMPFFLMYVIVPFCGGACDYPPAKVYAAIVWLGYLNSLMNPVVYTIFNDDFRAAFAALLTNCH